MNGSREPASLLYSSLVIIRLGAPADLGALLALVEKLPAAARWSSAQYSEMLAAQSRLVLVAEEEASIHGFLVAQTSTSDWELENIVVAAAHQRCGLGTKLLNELLERARRAGASNIFLEVRASNHGARAFYTQRGFAEIGRRPNYYTQPNEDALLYRLNIAK